MYRLSFNFFGDVSTPQDIRRLRLENMDMCRTMGQPIIWRHRFDVQDLESGYTLTLPESGSLTIEVERCPACHDSVYDQARGDCPVCFNTTMVSTETLDDLWINERGYLTSTDPGEDGQPAPRWGGFGPPVLTWMMQPDAPEEIFRLSERGVLTRTERNQGFAPWYPKMSDGDILINVELSPLDFAIEQTTERFLAATVQPMTIRGFGRMTSDRRFLVGQQFSMEKLPSNHILQGVAAQ